MWPRLVLLAAVLTLWTALTGAQEPRADDYPARPIRIVVPSGPGGGIDVIARLLAPQLSQAWGKPVVVDNRPGAGGIIGSDVVAKSHPDGYTILITAGGYTLNPSLYKKLPYDTMEDFERVSLLACAPNLLVTLSTLPVHSLQDLIAYAKAHPNELNYASSGTGTTSYLAAELMKARTGIAITHVPYKGAGQSNMAILAGEVQLIFAAPHTMVPFAREGRVQALAVTSAQRLALIPEVPTMAEAGLPGFDVNSCYGVLVPAGTPAAIVNKLSSEIVRILHLPDVKAQLESQSFAVIGSTPEEFTAFAREDLAHWARELKAAGIEPE